MMTLREWKELFSCALQRSLRSRMAFFTQSRVGSATGCDRVIRGDTEQGEIKEEIGGAGQSRRLEGDTGDT